MSEVNRGGHEQEPKAEDAARLASVFYYSLDFATKDDGEAVREVVGLMEEYIDFRAQQDPEMGHALVAALESFRDPDPTLATLEAAADMQERANEIRRRLGLPVLDLPSAVSGQDTIPDVEAQGHQLPPEAPSLGS